MKGDVMNSKIAGNHPVRLSSEQSLTLADKAYDLLEEMIVTLRLPPGSVVNETDLGNQIEIGRTPVREALQRFRTQNLLVVLPRRGMIVKEINIAEQLIIVETRRVLDRLLVSKAAVRATSHQREELLALAELVKEAAASGDIDEFMRLDSKFDEILTLASRNVFAAEACAPLHVHCRRFWYMFKENADLVQSASLHANIMNAVAEGDETKAAAASDALIDYVEELTRKAIDLI